MSGAVLIIFLIITQGNCLHFLYPVAKNNCDNTPISVENGDKVRGSIQHPYNLFKTREDFVKLAEQYIKNHKPYNYQIYKPYNPVIINNNKQYVNIIDFLNTLQTLYKPPPAVRNITDLFTSATVNPTSGGTSTTEGFKEGNDHSESTSFPPGEFTTEGESVHLKPTTTENVDTTKPISIINEITTESLAEHFEENEKDLDEVELQNTERNITELSTLSAMVSSTSDDASTTEGLKEGNDDTESTFFPFEGEFTTDGESIGLKHTTSESVDTTKPISIINETTESSTTELQTLTENFEGNEKDLDEVELELSTLSASTTEGFKEGNDDTESTSLPPEGEFTTEGENMYLKQTTSESVDTTETMSIINEITTESSSTEFQTLTENFEGNEKDLDEVELELSTLSASTTEGFKEGNDDMESTSFPPEGEFTTEGESMYLKQTSESVDRTETMSIINEITTESSSTEFQNLAENEKESDDMELKNTLSTTDISIKFTTVSSIAEESVSESVNLQSTTSAYVDVIDKTESTATESETTSTQDYKENEEDSDPVEAESTTSTIDNSIIFITTTNEEFISKSEDLQPTTTEGVETIETSDGSVTGLETSTPLDQAELASTTSSMESSINSITTPPTNEEFVSKTTYLQPTTTESVDTIETTEILATELETSTQSLEEDKSSNGLQSEKNNYLIKYTTTPDIIEENEIINESILPTTSEIADIIGITSINLEATMDSVLLEIQTSTQNFEENGEGSITSTVKPPEAFISETVCLEPTPTTTTTTSEYVDEIETTTTISELTTNSFFAAGFETSLENSEDQAESEETTSSLSASETTTNQEGIKFTFESTPDKIESSFNIAGVYSTFSTTDVFTTEGDLISTEVVDGNSSTMNNIDFPSTEENSVVLLTNIGESKAEPYATSSTVDYTTFSDLSTEIRTSTPYNEPAVEVYENSTTMEDIEMLSTSIPASYDTDPYFTTDSYTTSLVWSPNSIDLPKESTTNEPNAFALHTMTQFAQTTTESSEDFIKTSEQLSENVSTTETAVNSVELLANTDILETTERFATTTADSLSKFITEITTENSRISETQNMSQNFKEFAREILGEPATKFVEIISGLTTMETPSLSSTTNNSQQVTLEYFPTMEESISRYQYEVEEFSTQTSGSEVKNIKSSTNGTSKNLVDNDITAEYYFSTGNFAESATDTTSELLTARNRVHSTKKSNGELPDNNLAETASSKQINSEDHQNDEINRKPKKLNYDTDVMPSLGDYY